MTPNRRIAITLFAAGMVGLGTLALIYRDFALVWQPVPLTGQTRATLAVGSGVFMVATGLGLLFDRTRPYASWALFPYLIVWLMLKGPAVMAAPGMEAVWLGVGELAVLLAGGWVLIASGRTGILLARILFGVALIPVGLSHIVYLKQTVDFVPAWLPFRESLAYLTGIGQIACGVGALIPVAAQLAAAIEALMLTSFAGLVWAPAIAANAHSRLAWTAFFITWAIAASAWLVATRPTQKVS